MPNSLSAQLAATIAITHPKENQDILQLLLMHPKDHLRAISVQSISQLWAKDSTVTTHLLEFLANQIRVVKLWKNVSVFDSLVRCSFLLVMHEYVQVGDRVQRHRVILPIWRQLIRRLLLVQSVPFLERGVRRFRRLLLRIFVNRIVATLRGMAEVKQVIISIEDIEMFFPADTKRQEVFQRLMPHLDAGSGQAPESLTELVQYLKDLIQTGFEDYLCVCLALGAFFAHNHRNPLETAQAVDSLLQYLETVYPPTTDVNEPTARIWYAIIIFALSGANNFTEVNPSTAQQLLEILDARCYVDEQRFMTAVKTPFGRVKRGNPVVNCVWGYELDIPSLGRDALQRFINLYIEREDFDQIEASAFSLAEGIDYLGIPTSTFKALYDLVQLLQPQWVKWHPERIDSFWDSFEHNIAMYAAKYHDEMKIFLEMFDAEELPDRVRIHLRNTSPREDYNRVFALAILQSLQRAFKEPDSFVRESMVKWAFQKGLEVNSFEEWILEAMVYLANMLYGETLIASSK